jgi:hypothetical protein
MNAISISGDTLMTRNCRVASQLPLAVFAAGLFASSACALTPDAAVQSDRDDVLLLAQRSTDQAQTLADEAMREADRGMQVLDTGFLSRELAGPREIVKNAPYTAEAVTETTQMLMDGNRIVRKSVTMLARDSVGRMRQEQKGDQSGRVYIYDPVEDRSYVMRTSVKTAVSLPRLAQVPVPPTPPAPPAPPKPPETSAVAVQPGRVIVRRATGSTGDQEVHVEVIRVINDDTADAADFPVAPIPPLPPLTLHGHALALPEVPRDKGVTEALGARDFDGVKAEGKRTTHTIPAGAIGNEKPIAIVSERWFSPELNVVMLSRNVDPRSGETVYRLTNVKRGEPAADLFKIPADYKVRGEERLPRGR